LLSTIGITGSSEYEKMLDRWIHVCGKLNGFFENCFEKWARFVYRHNVAVIIISLVVSLALCAGFVRFKQQSNSVRLYYPQDSTAFKELKETKPFFNMNVQEMDFIIVSASKTNIIRRDVFDRMKSIQQDIDKIRTKSGLTIDTQCFKSPSGSCVVVSPLDLISSNNLTSIQTDLLQAYRNNKLMGNGRQASVNFPGLFGNLEIDQASGNISATSIRIVYPVHVAEDSKQYDKINEFDGEYKKLMEKWSGDLQKYDLDVIFQSPTTADKSVNENSGGDISLMVIAICIMLALCTLFMARVSDTVESHFLIGIVAIFSIILGIGSGFGIIMAAGQWYVAFVGVLPFLVLAVGVDDMFIMVDELDSTAPNIRGEDRIAHVLKNIGAPITMTTLTDLVAFAISTVSDFPGIRYFAQYAAVSLATTYLMMMTLFLGVLKFDIQRVEKGRRDYFPCCLREKGREKEPWKRKSASNKIMGTYARVLMKTPVRIGVCIVYLGLLAAGIYGFTKLEVRFDMKLLGKDGSNFVNWIRLMESEYPSAGWSVSIVSQEENVDYTSLSVHNSIIGLNQILNDSEYYDGSSVVNWLSHLHSTTNQSIITGSNFYPSLRSFLITHPQYLPDLIFTEGHEIFLRSGEGKIRASRITVRTEANANWEWRRWSMANMRKDLIRHEEQTGLHFIPVNYKWVLAEAVALVAEDTARNVGICALAVLVITLPYVVHPGISFFMLLSFAGLILELTALMVVWNVQLNTIPMTIIVMAIGFSVDYMAHIAHAYVVSSMATPEERMIQSLTSIGGSVMKGGISTFVGVLATAFSSSKMFVIFFKMMFGIVVLGLLHGILFLPVLLTIFCRKNLNLRSSEVDTPAIAEKDNPAYEIESQEKTSPGKRQPSQQVSKDEGEDKDIKEDELKYSQSNRENHLPPVNLIDIELTAV